MADSELRLLLCTGDGPDVPVTVTADGSTTVSMLGSAVADHLAHRPGGTVPVDQVWCDRIGPLRADDRLERLGLRHGDRLVVGGPAPAPASTAGATVRVGVVGGPASGATWVLAEGEHVVGRAETDVVIADPDVSRLHAKLVVDPEGQVWVSDLGSSNGTFVDGHPIPSAAVLQPGAVVEVGSSLLRILRRDEPAATSTSGPSVRLNRPPRVVLPDLPRPEPVPAPPDAVKRRRLPRAAIFSPLLIGAGAALLFGPQFLILALLSPIGFLWQSIEERSGERGEHRDQVVAFRGRVREVAAASAASLAEEVRRRHDELPGGAEVADRAARLSARLWERRPTDDDFLRLRCGWADEPARSTVTVEAGGDPELRAEAVTALAHLGVARGVPVDIDLGNGHIGLVGRRDDVDAMARWLGVQVAVAHSPRDVVIAAAWGREQEPLWRWALLLPHVAAAAPVLGGEAVVVGDATPDDPADGLLQRLVQLGTARLEAMASDQARALPQVVVFVDPAAVHRSAVHPLLDLPARAGISVVWLGSRREDLPGSCRTVVDVAGPATTVEVPSAGRRVEHISADLVDRDRALDVAAALAPLVDESAETTTGGLPTSVRLSEVTGLASFEASDISQAWATSGPASLRAPIGWSSRGPVVLDLTVDGPHALVAGTTGSGKSELLQTWVGALAAQHSPEQVTFFLIDYKGGAAFRDCVSLPHTVGFVTDLDSHLSRRALIALDAELRHREGVLSAHGANDLPDLRRRAPEAAMPSMVIVIDEFATLVKEVPEFVDGIINVAQRGRSLGIHLVLATQRPAGAINDNIRANTNLRIALRMNDSEDSTDVIASPAAARLSRSLPGRCYVRTGASELAEVQVAFAGAPARSVAAASSVTVTDLVASLGPQPVAVIDDPGAQRSELEVLVEGCRGAAVGLAPARRPWIPPLPEEVRLDAPADAAEPALGGHVDAEVIGLVDRPELQRQEPFRLDLAEVGSVLVTGASGSGKTTALRTISAALAARWSPRDLHLYAVDFATGGLAAVGGLPHCSAVVTADDLDRAERLVRRLRAMVAHRRRRFAASGVSTLEEHRLAHPDEPMARVVVLVDGFGAFRTALEPIELGALVDGLPQLVSDGRSLGIHLVVTANQRSELPLALFGTIGQRIILRANDEQEYGMFGLAASVYRGAHLPPGRGFTEDGLDVQLAVVGGAGGQDQLVGLASLGAESAARHPGVAAPPFRSLPDLVTADELPPAEAAWDLVVGVGGADVDAVRLDLERRHLLVVGGRRTGRSTSVAAVASSLARSVPGLVTHLCAPRGDEAAGLAPWTTVARGRGECIESIVELDLAGRDGDDPPMLVAVDDVEVLDDYEFGDALDRLVRDGAEHGVHMLLATSTSGAERPMDAVRTLLLEQPALLLAGAGEVAEMMGVRLPRRPAGPPIPGRATLILDGEATTVQCAVAAVAASPSTTTTIPTVGGAP
jgi:S-DNA-T family DNA segregation ATPase FtsK/SpoIIIE